MDSPFKAQVGAVLSADIAVPEHERELRFYSRVLRTGEAPRWREDLMSNIGVPVIGLGPMSAEYSNLPLQWMPHIQVADVAGSVRRALDSGAREVMHAKAPDGTSQWAVLLDPNGAAFGLVAVVPEEYVPVVPTEVNRDGMGIGRIAWLDLVVSDAAATRDFYMNVVGWSYREVAMDDDEGTYADYVM